MKRTSLRLAVLLTGVAFVFFLTATPTVVADEWNLETKITPDHQIEVPGAVLDANTTYRIALLDSPSERKVVQLYDADRTHLLTQFIAISDEKLRPVDDTTFEFMEVPAGHPVPVQAWFYPGRRIGLEFLYSQQDKDKFAGYWREQRTEQVAQAAPPEPAVVEQSTAIEPAPQVIEPAAEPPAATDQAVIEEPKTDDSILRSKPTEPETEPVQIAQNTEPAPTPAPREELPSTAGELQLIGLMGALATTLGLGVRALRR
jgi:hypothetical protein